MTAPWLRPLSPQPVDQFIDLVEEILDLLGVREGLPTLENSCLKGAPSTAPLENAPLKGT